MAIGFGAAGSVGAANSSCGSGAGSSFALRRLVIVVATTGSIPIAASLASVAISVAP